jgi:hypothetical protein
MMRALKWWAHAQGDRDSKKDGEKAKECRRAKDGEGAKSSKNTKEGRVVQKLSKRVRSWAQGKGGGM